MHSHAGQLAKRPIGLDMDAVSNVLRREGAVQPMQLHSYEWHQVSAAERLEHCLARSHMARNRPIQAEGNLKYAYLEIAASWLLLAAAVQGESIVARAVSARPPRSGACTRSWRRGILQR